MRVIAGRAGGVRLTSPKSGVRPTMDRVKAAIFSSLGEMVIGARVLDLFAGTGALGSKALPQLIAPGGFFILEKRPGESLPEMKSWRLVRQKTYGATEVLFFSAISDRCQSGSDNSEIQ